MGQFTVGSKETCEDNQLVIFDHGREKKIINPCLSRSLSVESMHQKQGFQFCMLRKEQCLML